MNGDRSQVTVSKTLEKIKEHYVDKEDLDTLRIVCFIHDFQDEDSEEN